MTRPALTVGQVASRLAVSRGAIYAAVQRGEIPCIRIGRAVRIPAAAIERMESAWSGSSSTGAGGMPRPPSTAGRTERPFGPVIVPLPSDG